MLNRNIKRHAVFLAFTSSVWISNSLAGQFAGHDTDTQIEIVQTPFGQYPKGCVHEHPHGTTLEEINDGVKATYPTGEVKFIGRNPVCDRYRKKLNRTKSTDSFPINGWFNWTGWYPPKPVAKFSASYTVPSTPSEDNGQILYYFIGTQDNHSSPLTILQPVLAFNGFKKGWNLSSWNCCPGSQVHHTPFITGIKPGDRITALIQQTKINPSTYAIIGVWKGQTANLNIKVGSEIFDWADVTLEVYYVDSCEEFSSGKIKFNKLKISDAKGNIMTPNWNLNPPSGSTVCNGQLNVNGNTVTIQQNRKSK